MASDRSTGVLLLPTLSPLLLTSFITDDVVDAVDAVARSKKTKANGDKEDLDFK